jgi:hypothetical protein
VLDAALAQPSANAAAKKQRRWPLLAALIFLTALLLSFLVLNMSSRVKELDQKLAQLKAAEIKQAEAEKNKPVLLKQEEKSRVAESAEVPDKPAEGSAALSGKILVDTQVKIVDGQQTAGEIPDPAATVSEAGPTESAVRQAEPNEGKTQSEQAVVAGNGSTPAAPSAEEQPPVQILPDEEKKTDEKLAVQLKDIPVLKAERKRLVRAKQPALAAANIQEKQAGDGGSRSPLQKEGSTPLSAETFLYEAQDGESLQDIAERFYGDRRYYPVILDQNPYLISNINSGNWMRLFADARSAAALYVRRTVQIDGLLLWKYKVQPGETWRTIYARFFPPRYSGRVFYEKDPMIEPGRTVLIILR